MAVTINTISSIHFLLIMFAGIIFTAFHICLRKRYLYSLAFTIIAFLFIEINTGLKPFSLTLLSLFIYVFILPKDESYTSYNVASSYIYMGVFYLGLLIIWSIVFGLDFSLFLTLFINLIIDVIFFGVFL